MHRRPEFTVVAGFQHRNGRRDEEGELAGAPGPSVHGERKPEKPIHSVAPRRPPRRAPAASARGRVTLKDTGGGDGGEEIHVEGRATGQLQPHARTMHPEPPREPHSAIARSCAPAADA